MVSTLGGAPVPMPGVPLGPKPFLDNSSAVRGLGIWIFAIKRIVRAEKGRGPCARWNKRLICELGCSQHQHPHLCIRLRILYCLSATPCQQRNASRVDYEPILLLAHAHSIL